MYRILTCQARAVGRGGNGEWPWPIGSVTPRENRGGCCRALLLPPRRRRAGGGNDAESPLPLPSRHARAAGRTATPCQGCCAAREPRDGLLWPDLPRGLPGQSRPVSRRHRCAAREQRGRFLGTTNNHRKSLCFLCRTSLRISCH